MADAPSQPSDTRAVSYFVHEVTPGAVIERTVTVANGDGDPLEVDVYVADARATNGWFLEAGRGDGELAEWATVSRPALTVGPASQELVKIRVEIPRDATPGERVGAVVADVQAPSSTTGEVRGRVGVRMYITVVGPGATLPVTDFTIDTLQAIRTDQAVPAVVIEVTNIGERVIDVAGRLILRDGPGGVTAGPFPVAIARTLGPGFSGEVLVSLDPDLPNGPWLAVASLASGEVQRRAQAVIQFPEGPGTATAPVAADPLEEQRRILLPVASLLLGLALGAWVLLAVVRRRDDEAASSRVVVGPVDDDGAR